VADRGGISGVAVFALLAGSVLAYSGITNKKISSVAHNLITGKNPAGSATGFTDLTLTSGVAGEGTPGQGVTATQTPGSASTTSNIGYAVAGANQAIGKLLATPYGWSTGTEWNDLVLLWDSESGWDNTADTRKTGSGGDNMSSTVFAYGIAQARPATKYPLPGRPSDLGGISDPTTQIAWGLSYIKSRYGSPSKAWAYKQSIGWY
jgi:hypothetical protein